MNKNRISRRQLVPLSRAHVHGDTELTLLIAAEAGKLAQVESLITSMKGKIQKRIEEIDYLRAVLPIERLSEFVGSEGISDLTLDSNFNYLQDFMPDPESMAGVGTINNKVRPEAPTPHQDLPLLTSNDLPAENHYVPTRDIRAPQFVASNPTFDGRGVTIGIVEGLVDLSHEVLQEATDLGGASVRKITGIFSPRDRGEENSSTIKMETEVEVERDSFTHEGKSYRAPYAGRFRFGIYGRREADKLSILWDVQSARVWVDTDKDGDFSDEAPVSDFNATFETIALPGKRSVPSAITLHPDEKLICIYRPMDHTTGMAGIAAGKGFLGGEANGSAPGARLVLISAGGNYRHHLIEAMVVGASHPEVDVLCCSTWAGSYPDDGESFQARMLDRIVSAYAKLIVIGAGNFGSGGLGLPQDISNGRRVLSVGGYHHRDTMREAYGDVITRDDWVSPQSSRGPSANGALKPDVIAPLIMVVPQTHLETPSGRLGLGPHLRSRRLPSNYQLTNGTSFAGPCAAGAVALLISAAKQSGVSYTPERLQWSVRAGARFLPDWPAFKQGTGLIDVESSWKLLKSDAEPILIETRATVVHGASDELRTPGVGIGLYEREGWHAGDEGERSIALRRADSSNEALKFQVSLLGDDGSFEIPSEITLPARVAEVSLPVKIHLKTSGAHGAVVNLADKDGVPLHQFMLTIVASDRFDKTSWKLTRRGVIEPVQPHSHFIDVPEGTTALRLDLEVIKGALGITTNDAAGQFDGLNFMRNPYILGRSKSSVSPLEPGTWSRVFRNPIPGVWEILIDESLVWDPKQSEYELSVEALRAEPVGTQDGDGARFLNTGALLRNARVLQFPAIVNRTDVEISSFSPAVHDIDVPEGTSILLIQLSECLPSDSDTALFLYRSSGETLYHWDFSLRPGGDQRIRVRNPRPGLWRAAAFAVHPIDKPVTTSLTHVLASVTRVKPRDVIDSTLAVEDVSGAPEGGEPGILFHLIDEELEEALRTRGLVDYINADNRSHDSPTEIGEALRLVQA